MCMRQQNKHCLDALVVLYDALMANSTRHNFRGEFCMCFRDDERKVHSKNSGACNVCSLSNQVFATRGRLWNICAARNSLSWNSRLQSKLYVYIYIYLLFFLRFCICQLQLMVLYDVKQTASTFSFFWELLRQNTGAHWTYNYIFDQYVSPDWSYDFLLCSLEWFSDFGLNQYI